MFTKDGIATGAASRKNDHSPSLVSMSWRNDRSFANVGKATSLATLILLGISLSGCLATALATGAASVAAKSSKPAAGPAENDAPKVQTTTNNAESQQAQATPPPQTPVAKDDLRTIRQELADGSYGKAHQDLELLNQNSNQLSQPARREVNDDLCLTEYLIGPSSYPPLDQQRTCSKALAEPGSVSGAILARIHDSIRQSAVDQVRSALKAQDLASAEGAALAYAASSGADPDLIKGWSEDFWRVVHDQQRPAGRDQRIAPVIALLANEYPQVKSMNESDFTREVAGEATVAGKSVVSRLILQGDSMDLFVAESDLDFVATHLNKFARINDAFAARCGCDARTNVGIADSGFPAYLFRLDDEENTSKVLLAMGEPETLAGGAGAANFASGETADQRNPANITGASNTSSATGQNQGVTAKPSQPSASQGNVAGSGGISQASIPAGH